ncbi:MAG: triacylglycerol lipase [Deltaproteobacteria bacterium]|nr:triacylglycerol lipase [Deltaproteobacteria bacterium]
MGFVSRVFLIPGFFGFASFGELNYFAHVRDLLARELARRGLEAEVIPVPTLPTASVPARAARLLATVSELSRHDDRPIHLVGHSSGGLDARLFAAPNVTLPTEIPLEPLASRVRSVVTVGTPHRGAPVARVFSGILGKSMLAVFSLATMYMLRFGRIPLVVLAKLIGIYARLDDLVFLNQTVLDQLYQQLLSDFSPERQYEIERFFSDVGVDQSLLDQLLPENMEVFNASVADRQGVYYGSVVARGRRPGLTSTLSAGLDPYAQTTHALYTGLWTMSSLLPPRFVRDLSTRQISMLTAAFEEQPTSAESDGVVPTLSQPYGEVIGCASADHLDLIGHFEDSVSDPPHYDWLASGSGFRRAEFERLWSTVANALVASSPGFTPSPQTAPTSQSV